MSGLNPSSIDLAISSKREIARVLSDLQTLSKYAIAIGSGVVTPGFEVNPTLGNNFQMEWDKGGSQLIIHNDFPIYSLGFYYYIDVINPATDKVIPLTSLSTTPAYNHIFLINSGNPNIGNIEIVPTSTMSEPLPVGIKIIYIGCVYRNLNDEINVINFGRLIDLSYLINDVAYINYLDMHSDKSFSISPTNILRFTAFFGPNITKNVTEVILFLKDEASFLRGFAYSLVTPHSLSASENLRITWKVTI